MTRKEKTFGAAAAGAVALALIFSAALQAQKGSEPDPGDAISTLIMPGGNSWLGVTLKDVTAEQSRDMKLNGEYGALVDRVEPDSPASKAGLQSGDIILEFAGERVRSVAQLARMVRETPAGRQVDLEVQRNGEKKSLTATVEPREQSMGPLISRLRTDVLPKLNMPVYDFSFNFGGPRLGVSVAPLTKQLADYFGVKDGQGVLVREVESGSAADKAGLKAGDCIVKLDSTVVNSAEDIHRALESKRGQSHDVTLTIVRNRQEQTLQAHLEAAPETGRQAGFWESTDNGSPDIAVLEAEARSLAPNAEAMTWQAAGLRAQLESERVAIRQQVDVAQAQAKAAQAEAQALLQQMRDHKGQYQQRMNRLEQQRRMLKDLKGEGIV
jgi:serine protease Do